MINSIPTIDSSPCSRCSAAWAWERGGLCMIFVRLSVPCLFPHTDLPVVASAGAYTPISLQGADCRGQKPRLLPAYDHGIRSDSTPCASIS